MKRFSFVLLLHIIAIALLSVGIYLCVEGEKYHTALILLGVLIGVAYHLYRMQMVQVRMLQQLIESLRYDDMMLSFHLPYRNREMQKLVAELSDAMNHFRTRILDKNEIEAWQKLIRVLTHEIMNSMAPIISLSETLGACSMEQENYSLMKQGMITIHRRSKGLLNFVEKYRALTKMPHPVRAWVSMHDLLLGVQKLSATDSAVCVVVPQTDHRLFIDRVQIEQVLINLVKNAQEACSTKENALIEVEMKEGDLGYCVIEVRDNGVGILPDVQDKIFVPFYTTKSSGSGIGLTLCKLIMNRHGGDIKVCSTVDKGSCFSLHFLSSSSES